MYKQSTAPDALVDSMNTIAIPYDFLPAPRAAMEGTPMFGNNVDD